MKFRDGYWGLKKGVTLLNPAEVRDLRRESHAVTIYTASKKLRHRGDSLNAPMITTEYSSPLPNVLHIKTYHFKGGLDRGPHFELAGDVPESLRTSEGADSLSLRTGKLSVSVPKQGPFTADYTFDGRPLTRTVAKLSGHFTLSDGATFMGEHLALSVGEQVYGLGERFTSFVKNGQVVDIWNEDGGTSSEQAYKNIPFYLTSKGYGVLVANPGRVSFEVASEVVTSVQFSVPGELLEYYLIGGETPKEVLRNLSRLVGRPALPPPWSFGLWLSTSFTTNYDEATVNSFVDGMAEREIPLSVFHFDCFWMKEFQWVDFEWDTEQFPDAQAMLTRLKQRGLKICVWINPYVAQKSRLFEEGMAKGYLVRNPDGSVWQWDRWQAGMALVDFTNAEAATWYQRKLKKLLDAGVDTFKTDFGERIPTEVVYSNGADPVKMHNFYTYLYNKTVFELLQDERGKNDAIVFARSATVGGQKFPVHWGGDCSATYASMAETLRGGLSLALSGFGFWSHDISGFEQTATPDLFKRWVAFGALSSHSRLHGNESYRVPWNFDDESSDILREFVHLKHRLMPYLFAQAATAASEGVPMIRPMVLEFPNDPGCLFLDREYMLGDSLLVAPIFSETGEIEYYLPAGVWTNFITNETVEGGRWLREKHDYHTLPLMARPNSLVPVGETVDRPDYDFSEGVCFHLFELDNDSQTHALVADHDGKPVTVLYVARTGGKLHLERQEGANAWSILLRGIDSIRAADKGRATQTHYGTRIDFDASTSEASIDL